MDVRFTAEAQDYLFSIAAFIARDNPLRAISFINEIEQKCLSLADMPEAFPLVSRYAIHGIRRRRHGDYLIFYRIEHAQIVIIHVLHVASDYMKTLYED